MTAIVIDDFPVGTTTLSLSVATGESVGVVGPEQEPLTAIVRACSGLEPVRRGRIIVDGVDVGRASRSRLIELCRRVGYVSVSGGLFSNLDVLDNLALSLRYRGLAHEAARARGRATLEELGLSDLADRRAAELSVEQQKLVAYVRATMSEPTIMLVEDPSAHLPPAGRDVVALLHDRLRERGGSALVVDDDREMVERIASRVLEVA